MNNTFPKFLLSGCTCNAEGSENTACDTAGKCTCKANVIGRDCDSCEEGYYGFPDCQGKCVFLFINEAEISSRIPTKFLSWILGFPIGETFGILTECFQNPIGSLSKSFWKS